MKTFPKLFKKSSTGALQQWEIGVSGLNHKATITTVHGQVDGKLQTTEDVVTKGKNVGKANETSAFEQAELEAFAKWEKQKKKGYVETMDAAKAGEVDEIIEGGINPMLAHPYSKQGHKIVYPCFAQPKLDGIRCIAILKSGECTLWSRTRKLITGVPHIAKEIELRFGHMGDLMLDGELYNHEFKHDFEKIVSFVRQETPAEGHEVVQYHVYDLVGEETFEERHMELMQILSESVANYGVSKCLMLVSTAKMPSEDKVEESFDRAITLGFEGIMLRNSKGLYANKRSYDLQKVKEFDDAEFVIVGIEEGRGKLAGHAIFKCTTEEGSEFMAKMKGETSRLKEYFDNHKLWKGKKLTVQYQGLTGKEKVPRFPVGIAIRDYE